MLKKYFIPIYTFLALMISAPYAHAVSITVEEGTNGDRLRISQIDTNQKIQSIRVSPDTLFIEVDNGEDASIQNLADITAQFVSNIVPSDAGLSIELGNADFGFIQSQDKNGDILIDIYPDALGSRWRETPNAKKAYDHLESIQALPSQNKRVDLVPAMKTQSLIQVANAQANGQNITPPTTIGNITKPQVPTNAVNKLPDGVVAVAIQEAVAVEEDGDQVTQTPDGADIDAQIDTEEEVIQPNNFDFSLSDKNSNEAKSVNPREILEQRKKEEDERKKQEELAKAALLLETTETQGTDTPQTETPQTDPPAPTENATGEMAPIGEIIYVDEAGNVVPAPLNIPQTIEDMRVAFKGSRFEDSLKAANLLRDKPLPTDIVEEILYDRLLSMYYLNRDTLEENGLEILAAANEALNTNLNAKRVPEAFSVLAVTSIALGHSEEARAHVDVLHRRYPKNVETPTAILLLANHYFDKGELITASSYLQILIDEYPNGAFAKEAALLQTKSLHKQGDYKKTMAFIDFIDRRWNRLYLTDPEYFTIRAEVEEDSGDYNAAASTYWLMYNLNPTGPLADFALYKISDLYYEMDQKDKAREVLDELVASFPKSQYRVSSLLKIGENGKFEGNLPLEEIFQLFNEPNPNFPNLFYKQIIKEYPDSQEAKYAKLRLAAQALWVKDYLKAADQALEFHLANLDIIESDRALEILLRAVAPVMSLSMSEKNYEQTLSLFERYPPIQEHYLPYEAPLRMALGRALLNRKQAKEGEEMLAPFMDKIPTTQEEFDNGLYAYSITLANALNKQDWNSVLKTSAKVEDWDLPKDIGLQRLYSTALAAENIGLPARSLPIWRALAPNKEVPLYQRAYAQYFLARDAERRQNLREAYQANLDTLAMFEDLRLQQSPYADNERSRESMSALMDITEIAGRYTESLEWLNKYRVFVAPESPDYAGLRLREARLHKKMGDNLRWRSILEQVRDKEPESVFGKMAASELGAFEMARDLNRFAGQ